MLGFLGGGDKRLKYGMMVWAGITVVIGELMLIF